MDNWDKLEQEMRQCSRCGLCMTRTKVVCGVGNPKSKLLLVGEGPGQQEDLSGEPFVGRGGVLLDKLLLHVGLSRKENLYIANMVKCRPPENRDPLPEETAACADFLSRQMALLNPAVVVCLGRVAATALIDPAFKITKDHGKFYEKNGRLYMGVYHPAYLLRNPAQKGAALDDLIRLQEKLQSMGVIADTGLH